MHDLDGIEYLPHNNVQQDDGGDHTSLDIVIDSKRQSHGNHQNLCFNG